MDEFIANPTALGRVVREARKRQGLTQEELAGLMGSGRRVIGDIENGKDTAQFGKVLSALNTLGVALHARAKWERP